MPQRTGSAKNPFVASGQDADVRIGDFIVHPYRAYVPEMPPEMLAELVRRTRESGQLYPVTLDGQGRVVDGRAQLRACLELGIAPNTVVTTRTDVAWLVADSVRRTPYSVAQCSVIAARLSEPLQIEARDRQRTAGKPLPKKFRKGEAAQIAARAVGRTSAPNVRQARRIVAEAPDVLELVESGLVERMTHATALADLTKTARKKAIGRIVAGEEPALVLQRRETIDDEWITPKYIVEAVRAALGGTIDCDPCSPGRSKTYVNATVTYTKREDGLNPKNPWGQRTFVNPPFSQAKQWAERAIREAKPTADSPGKHIFVLLPIRPDTEYQATLFKASFEVLLLADRVSFAKPGGKKSSGSGRSSLMIVALGGCLVLDLVAVGLEGVVVRADKDADLSEMPEDVPHSHPDWPSGAEAAEIVAMLERQQREREVWAEAARKRVATAREE